MQEESEDAESEDVGEDKAEEVSDEESGNEDDDDMDDSEEVSAGVEKSVMSSKYVSKLCGVELYFIYIKLFFRKLSSKTVYLEDLDPVVTYVESNF